MTKIIKVVSIQLNQRFIKTKKKYCFKEYNLIKLNK